MTDTGSDEGIWLTTDESEEVVSALEMTAEMGKRLPQDKYAWKWVILSLHSALQGFMVLALRQGNGLLALTTKSRNKWLEEYRKEGKIDEKKFPKEFVDSFPNLYKKIKSDAMLAYVHSKKFEPIDSQDWSVGKLNELRNDFIHFLPRTWIIEISGLPKVCLDCLEIIQFLAWESGNILFHKEPLRDRARNALRESMEKFGKLETEFTQSEDISLELCQRDSSGQNSTGMRNRGAT